MVIYFKLPFNKTRFKNPSFKMHDLRAFITFVESKLNFDFGISFPER